MTDTPRSTHTFDSHFEPQHKVPSERLFGRCASLRQAAELQVSDAVFKVKTSTGEKHILQGVSLTAKGGGVLALMGPSGAGKTTLLEFMTLSLKGGVIEGEMKLNSEDVTRQMLQKHAAVVEQYDKHWAFLTCREVMTYAASLYLVGTEQARKDHVQDLMQHLGLLDCGHTKCGNDLFNGLSGGQKKRLSLGIALLKGPSVLFLDEPTSGLDSAAAASVMGYVNHMAKDANMIVIATIHQPSTELFMSFTDVLFLANGRVAYHGPPAEVKAYFQTIGNPVPEDTNPADHSMQLINGEFTSHDEVEEIVKSWVTTKVHKSGGGELQALKSTKRPSIVSSCCTLLQRHFKLSLRHPTLYMGRVVVFIISNTFFALVYLKTRDREQHLVVSKYFLTSWMLAVSSMFSLVAVYSANEDFKIIRKEMKNGMTPLSSYLLATFFLQLPYMVVLSLSALMIPYYGLANANLEAIVPALAVMTAMLWSFEQSSMFLAVGFDNPLIGMLGSMGLWFASFLFCGAFLKPEFVVWPFKLFGFLFPLRWTFASMQYLEYHGTVWEGAEDLGNNEFACAAVSAMQCYGRTGDQVLASLSHTFPVKAENTVVQDIAFILAYGVAFKVLHIVFLVMKTQFGRSVRSAKVTAKTGVESGTTDNVIVRSNV